MDLFNLILLIKVYITKYTDDKKKPGPVKGHPQMRNNKFCQEDTF